MKTSVSIISLVFVLLSLFTFSVAQEPGQMEKHIPFIYGLKISGPDTEKVEKLEGYFEVARDIGFTHLKIFVTMDFVHPDDTSWFWQKKISGDRKIDYDNLAGLSMKYGISIIPMFISPIDIERQKNAKAYSDFVYQFIRRYKESMHIGYIELQNEPNQENDGSGTWSRAPWRATALDLVRVDNATYDRIKSVYPDIVIGSAGFINGSRQHVERYTKAFYKAYFEARPKFDVFMFHDYPKNTSYLQGTRPGDLASEYYFFETYRSILIEYGYGDKPILISEGFVDTPFLLNGKKNWNWLDEDEASVLWVESYIHTLSNSQKFNIGAKIITGVRTQGTAGLIDDRTGTKRKQYYAVKRLVALLKEYPIYSRSLSGKVNSSNPWIEEFKNKKGHRAWIALNPLLYDTTDEMHMPAVTSKKIVAPQAVTLEIGKAKSVKVETISGTEIKKASNGKITFEIGRQPVFLTEEN